jgi:hypothetical protein
LEEKIMLKFTKKSLIVTLIAALVIIPFASPALSQEYTEAEDPSGASMLFDTVLVRPIGIVATAVGAVFFVVSWPFSALGDNVDEAGEKLVKDPARFTFKRPLGEF